MPGLIWLASYPKSGNTWLRAFLANYLADADHPVDINDLHRFGFGDGFWRHYERISGCSKEDLTPEDVARLRPQVHAWFAQSRSQEEVFVKTHNTIASVLGTPLITPAVTAGAVYVVRNPLDVAVSLAHHYGTSYVRAAEILGEANAHLPRGDEQAAIHLSSWSRHVAAWLGASGMKRLCLRYEDMRLQPNDAFAALVGFLGFKDDPARLEKALRFASFQELAGQEQSRGFNESRPDGTVRFFRAGRVGQWRGVLDNDLIRRIVTDHSEMMAKLGYLNSAGEPCDPPQSTAGWPPVQSAG